MKQKFLIGLIAFLTVISFYVGYSTVAKAFPSGGILGRGEYHGYFSNTYDTAGTYVLPRKYTSSSGSLEAFPATINSAAELISFLSIRLDTGDTQEKTGAAFIIETMLGRNPATTRNPKSNSDFNTWADAIRSMEAHGDITWRTNFTYTINSFYQGATGGGSPNDDAFYDESGTAPAMIFRDGTGKIVYVLKWLCANPVGNGDVDSVPFPWSATGSVSVSDTTPDPGDTPTDITTRPGETLNFVYKIVNNGPGATNPSHIWFAEYDGLTDTVTKAGQDSGAYAAGQTKIVDSSEKITVPLTAAAGTKYCRYILWDHKDSKSLTSATSPPACATVVANYDLTPHVNYTITDPDGNPKPGGTAEPGDTVTFKYSVNNGSGSTSASVGCTIFGSTKNGSYTRPAAPAYDAASDAGYTPPATGCPRTFPSGDTNFPDESVATGSSFNKTICRSLEVNPSSAGGGPKGDEACVPIAASPYLRVYGGDVSAGNGQTISTGGCTSNPNAAIVSWNKEAKADPTKNFAGAGTQFAAMALNQVVDFASAESNNSLSGKGLAFANTTASGGSVFGGSLGGLPCIDDFYSKKPAGATTFGGGDIGGLGTGSYATSGNINLSGTLQSGARVTIFVNGDVTITGAVSYPANWTTANPPLLQIVAKGNIYVDKSVQQISGLYIAQQGSGGAGGIIYTCTSGSTPAVPGSATYYSDCKNKLTINGSLTAYQVQFLRTGGTLSQSATTDGSSSNNPAEVFVYSPAFWMAQPSTAANSGKYDSIISLPPIL